MKERFTALLRPESPRRSLARFAYLQYLLLNNASFLSNRIDIMSGTDHTGESHAEGIIISQQVVCFIYKSSRAPHLSSNEFLSTSWGHLKFF